MGVQLQKAQAEAERARQLVSTSEHAYQLRVDEKDAEMAAETARLQREVDHLRALQNAALAAGSYKGRQMLYMDSLKAPPPRANDKESHKRAAGRSGLSWRDGGEVAKLTSELIGPAPSSLTPTETAQALGETFGPGDKHVIERMLAGGSAEAGVLSHAPPGVSGGAESPASHLPSKTSPSRFRFE